LSSLGTIYSTEAKVINYNLALDYYNQALRIYQELIDWRGFYGDYRTVGYIYNMVLHNPKKATEAYDYAIANGGNVYPGSAEDVVNAERNLPMMVGIPPMRIVALIAIKTIVTHVQMISRNAMIVAHNIAHHVHLQN
jgi:tetratricopeptide (TPR) repeat protein